MSDHCVKQKSHWDQTSASKRAKLVGVNANVTILANIGSQYLLGLSWPSYLTGTQGLCYKSKGQACLESQQPHTVQILLTYQMVKSATQASEGAQTKLELKNLMAKLHQAPTAHYYYQATMQLQPNMAKSQQ